MLISWRAAALALAWLSTGMPTPSQAPAAAPPRPPAAERPDPSGSIAGRVQAPDGAPLARARIVAQAGADAAAHVALSGADGRFTIAALEPGRYTVTASRTGYASQTYNQPRDGASAGVEVAAGQRLTGVDFSLRSAGLIIGRILDEDGSPFAGATVEALRSRMENGQHLLQSMVTAISDDRGEFRLFGLAPGEYYVSAHDPAFNRVASAHGPQRYVATYYPGTSFADEARPITIPDQGAPPRIEFKLKLLPPAYVSGQLTTSDQRQLLSGAVIMTAAEGDGISLSTSDTVSILPDGRFEFGSVPPGHYVIRARGLTQPKGVALFAQYTVTVEGMDVADVAMLLHPGALLDGALVLERHHGTATPAAGSLQVRALFPDGSGFGDALTGVVDKGGRFVIRGVMEGRHQLVVQGLARPWTVKSILFRGHDVTDELIEAEEGAVFHDVRITVVDEGAEVGGTVHAEAGTPAADAGVLVYAVAPQFWMRTNRRVRVARTDGEGRYSIYGLPPGEYFAVAAPDLDEGDLARTSRFETMRTRATRFNVPAGPGHTALDLQLAPVSAAGEPR